MKMRISTAIVAILIGCGICLPAKAEAKTKSLPGEIACDAQCSKFKVTQTKNAPVETIAQDLKLTQRTSQRRTRGDSLKKIYLGGTVGFFLPSDLDDFEIDNEDFDFDSIDTETGFGGSAYVGYKFNSFLSADLEVLAFTGNAEPFDSDYTSVGFFINPRYTLPIGGNPNASLYVFASPGIGIAGVGFGDDIEEQISEDGLSTGVALQLKAGVGLPISETIDVVGQARYFNAFKAYEITSSDGSEEDQGFSSFSLEAGLNFKL